MDLPLSLKGGKSVFLIGTNALVLSFPFAFLTLTRWTLIAWLNYASRPLEDSAMPGLHLAVDSWSQSI